MNTDNMLISGETIDYGPCAFMDTFDPATVFSSIDHNGVTPYGNQPGIAHWNLAGLAQVLPPLLEPDRESTGSGAGFDRRFSPTWYQGVSGRMRTKLGLTGSSPDRLALINDLLTIMAGEAADFTLTFRRLSELANSGQGAGTGVWGL